MNPEVEQAKRTLRHALESAAEIVTQFGGTTPPSPKNEDVESMLAAADDADAILCEYRSEDGMDRQKAWEDARTVGGKQAENVLTDLQAARDALRELGDEA